MIRAREDRLFESYRRKGDVTALAALFDGAAPELWRIASHLERDRHLVEDAVQSTFLVAIEQAHQWDRAQRVLPWLIGILTNQLRTRRRREALRAGVELADPAVERAPEAEAAHAELLDRVAELTAQLGAPYREAVDLHLSAGLAAREIAARLCITPNTARVRLHRGLSLLRRLLPSGATVAVAVSLSAPRLAAMRAVVVARGTAAGAKVAAAGTGLGLSLWSLDLLMKKTATVLSLALLALLGVLGWHSPAESDPSPEPGTPVVLAAPEALAPEPGAVVIRQIAAPSPAAAAASRGRLRLRVRDGSSQAAIAGTLVRWASDASTVASQEGHTDAAGEWTIQARPGRGSFELPQWEVAQACEVVTGAETVVVVDLPTRVQVELTVLDARSRPVSGARVVGWLRTEGAAPVLQGTTDVAGRFAAASPRPHVVLWAERDGAVHSEIVGNRLGEAYLRRTLTLREGAATLRGTVVDALDRPVSGALIAVHDAAWPAEPGLRLVSDADGRFTSQSVRPGGLEIWAVPDPSLGAAGRGQARWGRAHVEVAAGADTSVVLRLGGTAGVTVRVADQSLCGGTVAVEPFVIVAFAGLVPAVKASLDVAGTARVTDLAPGRYRLTLHAGERRCSTEATLVAGATFDWAPSFDATTALRVRCLDERGEPLVGWGVTARGASATSPVAAGETGADGRGTIEGVTIGLQTVELTRPGASAGMVFRDIDPSRGEAELRLGQHVNGGRLRGRLVGPGTVPSVAGIEVQLLGDVTPHVAVLAADGTFTADLLPPGDYEIVLQRDGQVLGATARVHRHRVVAGPPTDVGDFEVAAMGSLRLRAPGAIAGDLTVAFLQEGLFHELPTRASDDGVVVESAPGGEWELLIWGETVLPLRTRASIANGQVTDLDVRLTRASPCAIDWSEPLAGRLTLRVRDASGLELAHVRPRRARPPLRRGLAPGTYDVVVSEPRGKSVTVRVVNP